MLFDLSPSNQSRGKPFYRPFCAGGLAAASAACALAGGPPGGGPGGPGGMGGRGAICGCLPGVRAIEAVHGVWLLLSESDELSSDAYVKAVLTRSRSSASGVGTLLTCRDWSPCTNSGWSTSWAISSGGGVRDVCPSGGAVE